MTRDYFTGELLEGALEDAYMGEIEEILNTPRPTREQRKRDLDRIFAEEAAAGL